MQCTDKCSGLKGHRACARAGAHKGSFTQIKMHDFPGKSIFSANHLLIIAYGHIALLLVSINLVWQVSTPCTGGENSLGLVRLSVKECDLFVKESLTTTFALSCMHFIHSQACDSYSQCRLRCVLIICSHYRMHHTSETHSIN